MGQMSLMNDLFRYHKNQDVNSDTTVEWMLACLVAPGKESSMVKVPLLCWSQYHCKELEGTERHYLRKE